ncbi:class I SAM-dependent methyltransferase [Paenibacillus sp. HJGM_3]|uniref:class I SAM-dependent methyltransferase n=1 Tax=Paenibacillus sp. HJGM_3 TaxID=3379816 RepID=UPI00385EB185
MDSHMLKSFYDQVGESNGWDFSRLSVTSEGELWEFYEEARRECKPTDLLLDIGTGGGERLLTIADAVHLIVGIDQSAGMIRTAQANLQRDGHPHVRFCRMDAERLDFPASFFQVVSCRQSPFDAREVHRVLAQDGVFLTQQVAEDDKRNLKQALGRGQGADTEPGSLRDRYAAMLAVFATYEDLVFLLKHTPIVPGFGECEEDFDRLHAFIEQNRTDRGIQTNSKRFMIVARN